LRTWDTPQSPNPMVTPTRVRPLRLMVTAPWKAASECADPMSPETDDACVLDLTKAPLELIAIVNRPDLRIIANDDTAIAGEGRFVFQVIGPSLGIDEVTGQIRVWDATPKAQKMSVILEYALPVAHFAGTLVWAELWHSLGNLSFGAAYNRALERLTSRFSGSDVGLRRVNGSALNHLRTNEVALQGSKFAQPGILPALQIWEMREFVLTSAGLTPHTVEDEPSRDFDILRPSMIGTEGTRTPELIDYLFSNSDDILNARFDVPLHMLGNSAIVGTPTYAGWGKPRVLSDHILIGVPTPVRNAFAANTCGGCHRHESNTQHFMHITLVGAMDPWGTDNNQRGLIGLTEDTPDTDIALSNMLRGMIAPNGSRTLDFAELLVTLPGNLSTRVDRPVH